MLENRKYRIMLEEVDRFLLKQTWNDKELLKLKDDIRSLALYGHISDFECSQLLERLPNIHAGTIIEEDPIIPEQEEEEKPSQLLQFSETPVERYYDKDAEKVPEKIKPTGFGDFSGEEVQRFYDSSKDEDVDDTPSPAVDRSGFGSFSGQETSRFFNSPDVGLDDDDDDIPCAEPSSGFSGFEILKVERFFNAPGSDLDSYDDDDIIPQNTGKSSGFDSLF